MPIYNLTIKWYHTFKGGISMKRWLRIVLIVVFAAVFLGSSLMLANYYYESKKSQSQFDELANLVQQAVPTQPVTTPDDTVNQAEPSVEETAEPQMLPEYEGLFALNSHTVGWLKIEGTDINYPVMQTPEDPDYYLYTDFYGNYNAHGCLYARNVCDVNTPSDNITIYGHNMKDGSMFADLMNYRTESFYKNHPYIVFDTLTEHHTYEVFAVFKTSASLNKGFAYHRFVDAENKEDYNDFVETCRELAFYDTGVIPEYGDKLITLSTCEYTLKNGRLVVVARRIS